MRRTRMRATILAAVAALACADAYAQTTRSGGGSGDARLQQQLQQLGQERTALLAENTSLKKQVEELGAAAEKGKAGAATESDVRAARAAATQAGARSQELEAEIERRKTREATLVAEFRTTAEALRKVERDAAELRAAGDERARAFDRCALANVELSEITTDVLARYENQGFFASAARAEPFARIARTRVENLVDEYRERAAALRLEQAPEPPRPAAPTEPGG